MTLFALIWVLQNSGLLDNLILVSVFDDTLCLVDAILLSFSYLCDDHSLILLVSCALLFILILYAHHQDVCDMEE